MGKSPIFLKHPAQLKHRLCQYFPPAWTYPPSDFNVRTGRAQVEHSPLEPPLFVKHGLQRKRDESIPLGLG